MMMMMAGTTRRFVLFFADKFFFHVWMFGDVKMILFVAVDFDDFKQAMTMLMSMKIAIPMIRRF